MRIHPKGREHQHAALFRLHSVIEVVEERLPPFLDIGQIPEKDQKPLRVIKTIDIDMRMELIPGIRLIPLDPIILKLGAGREPNLTVLRVTFRKAGCRRQQLRQDVVPMIQ